MKTFFAHYEYIPPGPGGYEYRETSQAFVNAETESQALGFLLNQFPQTSVHWWKFAEIDTQTLGAVDIDYIETMRFK